MSLPTGRGTAGAVPAARLTWAVPISEVREILDAYKNPKGS